MISDPEIPADDLPKGKNDRPFKKIAVRYGYMNFVGEYTVPHSIEVKPRSHVVIQSDRGIEIGEPLLLSCLSGDLQLKDDQIDPYVHASGEEAYNRNCGRVLREATEDDLQEWAHICRDTREKLGVCRGLAERHNLPMSLVDCEHLFGGERIIFYFMADGRVDFRSLVKDLASEFKTRIEMRQIGARDEARLIADYETCGQQCCCRQFLKMLKPVTMKMAKMQKATLDPSKVSGRCGRLKCCLRYEHMGYEELERKLPRIGTRVNSAQGKGKVVSRQILTQLVQIETDEGGRLVVPVDELCDPDKDPPPSKEAGQDAEASGQEKTSAPKESSDESNDQRRGDRSRRPRSRHRKPGGPRNTAPSGGATDSGPASDESAGSKEGNSKPRKGRPGRGRHKRKKTSQERRIIQNHDKIP